MTDRCRVAIIGGGPAGLIAAYHLADRSAVHLYEQGRNPGRKFLVAGDGGLNITNSKVGDALFAQYTPADRMRPILEAFGPEALRDWLSFMGIPTFVGTSGRVFPQRGIKPAEVLKAIIDAVRAKGVVIHTGHRFVGFDVGTRPLFAIGEERSSVDADAFLFALGGASWARTGSTGDWLTEFERIGVGIVPFQAGNCGVEVDLPADLRPHIGKPLKNIAVGCGDKVVRGELTITEHGLEGNAIYPLVPEVRAQLNSLGKAELHVDLKPDLTTDRINEKLRDASWKERTATLHLDRPSLALLKAFTAKERYLDGRHLAEDVKQVRVPVHALRPIDEAISTVGGIALDEVNDDLSLKRHPNIFVAGEMLDWDAPTGGFLLQGAFSTGRWAAEGILRRR
ncbi:MAG TPA: TIGR03862 family flavoprotein [Flavobacteriales bacterium]|nr:TIGR03862 family flavoprotein [Flavobacteriales bacterium]HNU55047.1 TIGR03862 family flavoprotein [Flavobacteriales bacterium]